MTRGLPKAKRSKLSMDFERWCELYSWCMCAECGYLQPRDLTETTLTNDQKVHCTKRACSQCGSRRGGQVLDPEKVPEQLRDLSEEACAALSPLQIDVGPVLRAKNKGGFATGYRQHSTMMRFFWKPQPVKATIAEIKDKPQRDKAKAAFKFLLDSADTCYTDSSLRSTRSIIGRAPRCGRAPASPEIGVH